MGFKEQVMAVVEAQILPAIELAVKKEVDLHADAEVEKILMAIEEKAPGWMDVMIESQKVAIKSAVKSCLLRLADRISDKV